MNYIVVIDKHYLCYLHSLLESWWTNYRKGMAKWHIHYISYHDTIERLDNDTLILLRKHCAYFQNCNPNVTFEISITKSTLDADGREIPVGLHHNGNRRLTRFMAYCANIQTQIIPDILANLDNNDLTYCKNSFEQGGIIIATNNRKTHGSICLEIKKIIEDNGIYPL